LENTHALRPHIIRQDLTRINWLHGSESEGEDGAEDVYERDRGHRSCLASGLYKVGRGTCCDGETDCHPDGDTHEHFTATNDVVQACSNDCGYPATDGVDDIEEELCAGVGDAYVGNERWQI
jgi:hypothetical protein